MRLNAGVDFQGEVSLKRGEGIIGAKVIDLNETKLTSPEQVRVSMIAVVNAHHARSDHAGR